MPMHNALNRSQPDADAFKRLSGVKPPEKSEQLFKYFLSNPTPLSRTNTTTRFFRCSSHPISISARGRIRVNLTALTIGLTSTSSLL
jgi:hypothetical protein